MDQNQKKTPPSVNKIGFHYFQDTAHYTNKDLNLWLPELKKLKAAWLIIQSDASRAIPEQFIHGLIQQAITPIVHFNLRLPDAPSPADLHAILEAYAHWGVKYVVLFNTPNLISSWSQASWSQQDLVERFIDRFLPLAIEAAKVGLTPVFPPLEPGGDYWDTSFLRSALSSIKRRGYQSLLNNMPIAATSYTFNHDLTWGEGGPEKWQEVKPYFTPVNSEDQCGFNNYPMDRSHRQIHRDKRSPHNSIWLRHEIQGCNLFTHDARRNCAINPGSIRQIQLFVRHLKQLLVIGC